MLSFWLDKIFKLPPPEQRRSLVPDRLISDPFKGAPLPTPTYLSLAMVRTTFLITLSLSALYLISGVFNLSLRLGPFVISMPAHNFIYYFATAFSHHMFIVLPCVCFYYSCAMLANIPSYDFIFENREAQGRKKMSMADNFVNSLFLIGLGLVIMWGSFGFPLLILAGAAPSVSNVLANSYTFLVALTILDAFAFSGGVLAFTFSILGLFYYYPKYYRQKKRTKQQ